MNVPNSVPMTTDRDAGDMDTNTPGREQHVICIASRRYPDRAPMYLCGDVEAVISEQLARSRQPISHGVYLGYHLPDLRPILFVDSK